MDAVNWPTPTRQFDVQGSGPNANEGEALLGRVLRFGGSTSAEPADAVNRTHRLKAIGNGIVPACALPFALAIHRILTETTQ